MSLFIISFGVEDPFKNSFMLLKIQDFGSTSDRMITTDPNDNRRDHPVAPAGPMS